VPKTAPSAVPTAYAAIDFGTSNSAIALPAPGGGVRLVELEPGFPTMPTAVFYRESGSSAMGEPERLYGRAAVAAYIDGQDGRLMRSMKSILGSPLVGQSTDVGGGHAVPYLDIIAGYLRQLKRMAEASAGAPLHRVVLGRPVYFVDGEPERDALAQASLESAARQVGFDEVQFQFEPIAAALDHEQHASGEQRVLVADIGGGTSDFSLVRIGPRRRGRVDRRDDILANHGVHIAGTDFDRHIELAAILPLAGYKAFGPSKRGEAPREVPSGIYFDLATWHLINTVYNPSRVAEFRRMRDWFAEPAHHRRLMTVLEDRLGHALAGDAERAKIDVALNGKALIDLSSVERGLQVELGDGQASAAIEADLQRIADAALITVRLAGVAPASVDVLYFTGGSTGLQPLVDRIAAPFSAAQRVRGDRYASVAQGLGLHAALVFGAAAARRRP
jgi:hypothetical chaperone protein